MRAVVVTRPGDPDVLEIRPVPTPVPGRGEIRVRVGAFGVNRADLLQRRGRYPAPADAPADILGLEFAGQVDALGPGTTRHAVGDRVMGIAGGGTYAEYVVLVEEHAVAIPPGMLVTTAAAIPEAFVTAHDALRRIQLQAGETVLIHAVASGVGVATLQLAAAFGARVIGTSRSPDKLSRARTLGLAVGIDSSAENLVDAVRGATNGVGVHAVVDLVGGPLFPTTLACLAERGRLVLVGLTAGATAEVDLGVILRRRLRIEGTVLRPRSRAEKAAAVAGFADEVLPLLAAGAIRPVMHAVLPFSSVAEAHRLLEANATFGKVVVEVA
jgi:NADPH2:quinone reductase